MNPGSPFWGECLGTLVMIAFGNGVVAGTLLNRSKAQGAGWISITAGWAVAVFSGVAVASSLGDRDAHLNPAVTLASVLVVGNARRLLVYLPAQLIGAFLGAVLVWLHYKPHWRETESADLKFACFATAPAVRSFFWNFFSEALATFFLILVASALFSKSVSPGGFPAGLGPLMVGALVWGVGLSFGGTTGYAINPVRDFGPRLAHSILPIAGKRSSDWPYAWIPILGPLTGSAAAAVVVRLLNVR